MSASDRLKLRHLKILVAIAEHGSLVRAADSLAITQPAVSKTLAELEDIVGERLVERTRRGVELTAVGRLLVRYAGSGLRTIHEGLDQIALSRITAAPVLQIGVLPNVAATVLPDAIQRCLQQMPQTRIRVRTGSNAQLIGLLHQGILDLVIGRMSEPAEMQGLSFEYFYTEDLVFAVRPGHPLAGQSGLQPDALRSYRLVLPDTGTRIREAADRFFLASGLTLFEDAIETIDVSFGRSYVLRTEAVWCVPFGVVEHDLEQGRLVRVALDTAMTTGPVGLTLRTDRALNEALQMLIEEIRAAAGHRSAAAAPPADRYTRP